MGVTDQISFETYTSNGVSANYVFNHPVKSAEELIVTKEALDGTVTTWVLNTDFTVTGTLVDGEYPNGVTVVATVVQASGVIIAIDRDTDLTQETIYSTGGKFPAKQHEQALDKLTLIAQELERKLSRSLKVSPTSVSLDLVWPTGGASAADKAVIWNGDGTALVNSTETFGNVVSSAQAAQTAAEAAQTAAESAETNAAASATAAAASETAAANSAASINLPASLVGKAANLVQVNSGETGYEHLTKDSIFDGATSLNIGKELGVAGNREICFYSQGNDTDAAKLQYDQPDASFKYVAANGSTAKLTIADPTQSFHGATKGYVDGAVVETGISEVLDEQTVSAGATYAEIDGTSFLDDTLYSHYIIEGIDFKPTSNQSEMFSQISQSATWRTTANYQEAGIGYNAAGSNVNHSGTARTYARLNGFAGTNTAQGNATDEIQNFSFRWYPHTAHHPSYRGGTKYVNGAGNDTVVAISGSWKGNVGDADKIRIGYNDSGSSTIAQGTVRIYGVKK
jgi:hypothetical protein